MILGVLLAAFGLVSLIVRDMHFTGRRAALNSGTVEAKVRTERVISIPPPVAIASLAAGLGLMAIGARR